MGVGGGGGVLYSNTFPGDTDAASAAGPKTTLGGASN